MKKYVPYVPHAVEATGNTSTTRENEFVPYVTYVPYKEIDIYIGDVSLGNSDLDRDHAICIACLHNWVNIGNIGQNTREKVFQSDREQREQNGEQTLDLTDFIGKTITSDQWRALQSVCSHRHQARWIFKATEIDGNFYVSGLTAK